MSVKVSGTLLAMVAFCTGLMAQSDPFIGVWELNTAKTSGDTQGVLYQMLVNLPEPDGSFKSTRGAIVDEKGTGARPFGYNATEVHHYGFDGKFRRRRGEHAQDASYKRIDPYTIERYTKDAKGEARAGGVETVSKDGKTLTLKAGGFARVYEKREVPQNLDPFIGIWVLNPDKSKFTQGKVPISQMVVNLPEPDGTIKSTRMTVVDETKTEGRPDGYNTTEVDRFTFDGKFHSSQGENARDIAYKRVDSNKIERTYGKTQNGPNSVGAKQNGGSAESVSKDGMTLTISQDGGVRVLDKRSIR